MTIHYTVRLHCEECNAEITYVDERPRWRDDDERLTAIVEATTWLENHPGIRPGYAEDVPDLIRWHGNFVSGYAPYVSPLATRYDLCPSCDARVYIDQWSSAAEDDEPEDAATA